MSFYLFGSKRSETRIFLLFSYSTIENINAERRGEEKEGDRKEGKSFTNL